MKIKKETRTVQREVVSVVTEQVEEYVLTLSREDAEVLYVLTQKVGGSPATSDRGIVKEWAEALEDAGFSTANLAGKRREQSWHSDLLYNLNEQYVEGSITFRS